MNCGIYEIRNTASNKVYVGSSKNIKKRLRSHVRDLDKGSHGNIYLQRQWKKYGKDSFVIKKILVCDPENLIMYEQKIMDIYRSHDRDFGYNISKIAQTNSNLTSHGKSYTCEYGAWMAAKNRCYLKTNPAYIYCGAKGIGMCDDWRNSFENFYKDMGDRPLGCFLRRINPQDDYKKENCAWSPKENHRYTKRILSLVDVNGKKMTCTEASEALGLHAKSIHTRSEQKGGSFQDAANYFMNKKPFGVSGEKFNRLTLVRHLRTDKPGLQKWLFKCDCGRDFVGILSYVKRGNTKSCGCLVSEKASAHAKRLNQRRRGI